LLVTFITVLQICTKHTFLEMSPFQPWRFSTGNTSMRWGVAGFAAD